MKKTVQLNIGGISFYIDEDAYARLTHYLKGIEAYYAHMAEGKEILADIEARIAEILQDKISRTKQAVSLEDIHTVILILGEPEQFDDQAKHSQNTQGTQGTQGEPSSHTQSHNNYYHHKNSQTPKNQKTMERRRLFRDTENRKAGGVCSGLAAYVGVAPVIVRILFVVATLFYGSSMLLYVLLWAMLPEARTTAEKLEMHGEPINVNNIERTIKDEFNNLKRNVGI